MNFNLLVIYIYKKEYSFIYKKSAIKKNISNRLQNNSNIYWNTFNYIIKIYFVELSDLIKYGILN